MNQPGCSFRRINKRLSSFLPDMDYEIVGSDATYSGEMLMYAGLNVPVLTGDYASCSWKLRGIEKNK
jgi:hypothetical protein